MNEQCGEVRIRVGFRAAGKKPLQSEERGFNTEARNRG